MLFNYRYINHSIERFQTYLDHLVKKVWCRNTGKYSLKLLHPKLREIIEDIANDASIEKDWLDGPIKNIDALFQKKLTASQRAQVRKWYDHNNDIESLCAGDSKKQPGTYNEIETMDADLAEQLKTFCTNLFEKVIKLKAVRDQIGSMDDHYLEFVKENDEGKCPYCGYGDLKGQYHTPREAYDHYLPKGTYPFNSVNFKNLAPMCHECNSSYKLQKDPTWNTDPLHKKGPGSRRKAFYSYATVPSGISVSLNLNVGDVDQLTPADIDLHIEAPGRDEELETWKEVFGIEERFKAKCCGKNEGKYWLMQAIDECQNAGKTPKQLLDKIKKNARNSPWAECNFLKKPFLQACQKAGLV